MQSLNSYLALIIGHYADVFKITTLLFFYYARIGYYRISYFLLYQCITVPDIPQYFVELKSYRIILIVRFWYGKETRRGKEVEIGKEKETIWHIFYEYTGKKKIRSLVKLLDDKVSGEGIMWTIIKKIKSLTNIKTTDYSK